MTEIICIGCPKGCHLSVDESNDFSVTGYGCKRGIEYGKKELTDPRRVITSTVAVSGAAYPRCPVKTSAPVPKNLIFDIMKLISDVKLKAPVHTGDVIISDLLGTGVSLISTKDM